MSEGSAVLRLSFALLAIVLGGLFVAGVYVAWVRTGAERSRARRAAAIAGAGTALWLAATFLAAASGRLRFDTTPPTMMVLVAAVFAVAFGIGFSRVGARLAAGIPLAALVGVQVFRLPLELMMHRAYTEGLMPVQMSYSGSNFDIVTGATALVVAPLVAAGVGGARLVRVWNWLGILLLANVLVIAILSAPMPIRRFFNDPPNVWITRAPYVWLPAVMVLAALLGHILIARRLRLERRASVPVIDSATTASV